MNNAPLVPYQTILAAKAGNGEAMGQILKHFAPYIATFSRRSFYDEYGNHYEFVDEDIRQRIEAKLMYQIIYHFDPYTLPENT